MFPDANKPYKCNECGKGFAQRGGLVTHSLVHTGAKPYVCTVCKKAFRQKYHLTQHNLIHSGVKPFSCEICHKSFNVKMNLREHMRRHTGQFRVQTSLMRNINRPNAQTDLIPQAKLTQ